MHNSLRKNEKKNHLSLIKLGVFRGITIARLWVMNMKIKFTREFFVGVFFVALFASASAAYEEIAVKDGGTIRGSVKIDGKVPKLPPLEITKYKEICKDVPNESLLVGPGQGSVLAAKPGQPGYSRLSESSAGSSSFSTPRIRHAPS